MNPQQVSKVTAEGRAANTIFRKLGSEYDSVIGKATQYGRQNAVVIDNLVSGYGEVLRVQQQAARLAQRGGDPLQFITGKRAGGRLNAFQQDINTAMQYVNALAEVDKLESRATTYSTRAAAGGVSSDVIAQARSYASQVQQIRNHVDQLGN